MKISEDLPDENRIVSAVWDCCYCGEENTKSRSLGEVLPVSCSDCGYSVGEVDTGNEDWQQQADRLIETHETRHSQPLEEIVTSVDSRYEVAALSLLLSGFSVFIIPFVGEIAGISYYPYGSVGVMGCIFLSAILVATTQERTALSLGIDAEIVKSIYREAGE